jgi:glycolate oxidase FAD binding subunit
MQNMEAAGTCPQNAGDLADLIADAARAGRKVAIAGGGSKDGIGAPSDTAMRLDMRGFSTVIDYDPAELVLTVGAGVPLAEVERLVASEGQMLAFGPFDHGPIFGQPAGKATIGGIVAAGVSGPLRLGHGNARDHVLGLEAVSGQGEHFKAGAKVVKNVTGFDLPKLLTGSWGRLAAITQITLKVLPRPRTRLTHVVEGLEPDAAAALMREAMRQPLSVTGAAHWGGTPSKTALRIEGFAESVAARQQRLTALAAIPGYQIPEAEEEDFWSRIATARPVAGTGPLWRISLPASAAPGLVRDLGLGSGDWMMDWAGALLWIASDIAPDLLRGKVQALSGHAMLVRADEALRRRVPAFHPPSATLSALEARVRAVFDPDGIFDTGRF